MAENASAPASQRERIKAELASLKVFQGRVDELLTTFGESEATPTRIADDRLEQAHLGEGFTAAKRFYDVYDGVHADLMTLSQLLGDQIEALTVAVRDAHGGYEGTDADVRDRMWAIQEKLRQHHDPHKDRHAQPAPVVRRPGERVKASGDDQGSL
ncbi:hypothetical protein ABZ951_11070 [Streptomyces sp. NPDC046215]|uniref:Conjugal transfer protein TraB n=1 Tax=Streptomyces stramineus TaxID=173861 RepID=A0ABP3KTX5_9ACTN